MGLIKNWADVNGTKHQVDPTGHTHSTSESWLSTIVNNLTTLINGKAASATTLAGYGITDAYTKTQVDSALLGKANQKHITSNSVVNLDTELPTGHSIYLVHLTWTGSATTLGSAFTTSVSIVYNGCDEDTVINNYHTFLICRHNTICYIYYINPNSKADSSDIPTKTSDLTNDSGFLTSHQNISGKADKVSNATNGNFAALNSNGNLTDSGKKASDFANASHTHSQSEVSGLEDELNGKENDSNKIESWSELAGFGNAQYPCARIVKESLDKKLEATVNNLTATESVPADADDLTAGTLYLIDNTRQVVETRPKLNQIITCDADSRHHLCWHLDSGNLIKNYFMIRVFNWSKQVGTTTNIYHFVEVVGAWD